MSIIIPRLRRKPRLGACELDRQHSLSRDLAAWWLLNESGGVKLWDIAGANHGTLPSPDSLQDWVASPRGGAVDFFDNDYVDCGDVLNQPAQFTISCRLSLRGNQNNKGIAGRWLTDGYMLWLTPAQKIGLNIAGGTGLAGTTVLTANRWYDAVGTYDGTTSRIYVDGRLESEQAEGGPTSYTGQPWKIGSYSTSFFLNGWIEDCRVWLRALSDVEVRSVRDQPYANLLIPQYRRYFIPAAAAAGNPWYYYAQQ